MTSLLRFGLRDLPIDWSCFLNRAPFAAPTPESLDQLSQASVLITGAGGSIGSALSLRLAALRPSARRPRPLILLEASEQALYRLESDLKQNSPEAETVRILGSVNDADLLDELFATYSPEYVFHAAAHKHLTLLEAHPLAAIQNNTLATFNLINCAARHRASQPSRIVFLSTDKAADPTSILGATKRLAEQVVLAHQGIALRLVNVLGSEGSVVEAFLDQVSRGQPLTITHPDAERYFMTSEEAVNMLISVAVNAAEGSLLAPPLVSKYIVTELANFLISEHAVDKSISIAYSALRDGEKLVEQLSADDERTALIDASGCIPIQQTRPADEMLFENGLKLLKQAVNERDAIGALQIIRDLVPNYQPSPTVLQAVQRFARAAH